MSQKFNSKTFQGKKRIYRPVAGATLIARVLVWDETKSEYREPPRGNCYLARRVEMIEGKRKLIAQSFETLDEARTWQLKISNEEPAQGPDPQPQAAIEPVIQKQPAVEKVKPKKSSPLFREVVEQWKRRTYSRLSKGTQLNYEKYLKLHFSSVMGRPIETINSAYIDEWIDERKRFKNRYGKGEVRQSFKHELTLFGAILRYYIEYNDDTDYRHPIKIRHREAVRVTREATKKAPRDLTVEEFNRFREELAKGFHGDVMVALATVQFFQALRISEAAALRWEDVVLDLKDPKKSRLTVRQHIVYVRQKDIPAYIENGFKNASADEPVKEQPLFPASFEAMRPLLDQGCRGIIFRNQHGTFFSFRQIQAAYDKAFIAANLPYRGTHVLRHGGTRNVYNETGDLSIAQQLLGNSDLETTLVYARRHKGALTKLAESHWGRQNDSDGCVANV